MSAREVLDEIQQRADKATPGPWSADQFVVREMAEGHLRSVASAANANTDVAAFIAASRTEVPRLVAALRAVLDLHQPSDGAFGLGLICDHCTRQQRVVRHPCETHSAITEALGGAS